MTNINNTMRYIQLLLFLIVGVLVSAQTRYDVSSSSEFSAAQTEASFGDTIVWASGTYYDTRMDINKDGLIVTAESSGTVLFTGVSRVVIDANNITFSGFQYIGGFIGTLDVVRIYGSDVLITQINIQNYTSYKYLRVYEESRRTTISYCNFENRLNLDDQNILSILVDDEPGYHKIQYCSFKNFDGLGADQGIEPIRIGVSSQGDLDSRTLVEYCYFTRCNGDGEIISHKSRQNVYRYNTFENNPYSELVLRHGDEGIVYGNFFLNNRGGIRIREGSEHFIYNNYFEDIADRALWLMNDAADPLSDVHIYHNTIINSGIVRLGGSGSNPPSNVVVANNIFTNPIDPLFSDETGDETWISNLSLGELGIDTPSTGISEIDSELIENSEGYFQPGNNSPVLASSMGGYPLVPLYLGMDYDNGLFLDLMKEQRPEVITERAIGASEFSLTNDVAPHATETNTGPSYLFDNLVDYVAANVSQLYISKEEEIKVVRISSNIDWTITESADWINADIETGSGDAQLIITIEANQEVVNRVGTLTISGETGDVTIQIFQDAGDPVNVVENIENNLTVFPNPANGKVKLSNLPDGNYSALIELLDLNGKNILSREYQIEDDKVLIDLEGMTPGTYIINAKLFNQNGNLYSELNRRLIKI